LQGHLGISTLIPDLIREIALKNTSGLLKLSRGKSIKAVFFEAGLPVFAISNIAGEQLDQLLISGGLVTAEQIERAKEKAGTANKIAAALVEMGLLSDIEMRAKVRAQVMGIIRSVFEWTDGDYSFDERIRASHEVKLEMTVADVLLEGARHAATLPLVSDLLVPQDAVVLRAKTTTLLVDQGQLMPVESYVFSRIDAPTAVSEVGAIIGIGDDEAHKALCALVAAGFLKMMDDGKDDGAGETDEELERLREDVERRLHFYASADYYDVLGITRQSTTSEIKAAYYHMAKKFHPDRHRQGDDSELRVKLDSLFATITQAYDTLREPPSRAAYDERIRREGTTTKKPAGAEAIAASAPSTRARGTGTNGDHHSGGDSSERRTGMLHQPAGAPLAEPVIRQAVAAPTHSAEQFYLQGRARIDKKDYHAAVHLLREAVKIDGSKGPYHFHLGLALLRNPKTRREADEHLTKSAELDPYNSQLRVKLGQIFKEAGLPTRAQHYFKEALQLDPENKTAKKELQDVSDKKAAQGSMWKSDVGGMAKKLFKK
jgi:curved DNA-binding protein CbpA